MTRVLTLRRETLAELTTDQLAAVAGAAQKTGIDRVCYTIAYTGWIQCHTGATTENAGH